MVTVYDLESQKNYTSIKINWLEINHKVLNCPYFIFTYTISQLPLERMSSMNYPQKHAILSPICHIYSSIICILFKI